MNWRKARGCESNACPEVAVDDNGMILIRTTDNPADVVTLSGRDWAALVAEMRSERPFGIQEDGYTFTKL